MKYRVCLLGNSHLIAVQRAWGQAGELGAEFEPTFISAPSNRLAELIVDGRHLRMSTHEGQKLMANTSGGREYLDVDAFDCFVLCGLVLRFQAVAAIYATHRLAEHAHPDLALVSRDALFALGRSVLERSASFVALTGLRQLTTKPIVIVPEPLLSEKILDNEEQCRIWRCEGLSTLFELYLQVLNAVLDGYSSDLVFQPDQTISRIPFTKNEFAEGAVRMWKGHKVDDRNVDHMNDEYGAHILRVVLAKLSERLTLSLALT